MEAAGLNRNGNSQEEAQQRTDGSAKNGEPVAAANPVSGQASDGDAAVVIEAAETESSDKPDDASPDSTNGSGDGEGKPARRSRGRRSNGAANGGSAQDNDIETASSDDGSEPLSEDTGPASA